MEFLYMSDAAVATPVSIGKDVQQSTCSAHGNIEPVSALSKEPLRPLRHVESSRDAQKDKIAFIALKTVGRIDMEPPVSRDLWTECLLDLVPYAIGLSPERRYYANCARESVSLQSIEFRHNRVDLPATDTSPTPSGFDV